MWTNLCRCCMNSNSKVSLLDPEYNLWETFLEVTNIEIKFGEGLPYKLCEDCLNDMNTAHKFRKKCIKTDKELKQQLNDVFKDDSYEQLDDSFELGTEYLETDNQSSPNDPMKHLQSIIKNVPIEGDEDCYYVVVIGNPKDKGNMKDEFDTEFHNQNDENEESDIEMKYLSDLSYQSDDISDCESEKQEIRKDHSCKLCGKDFESSEILMGHTLLHSNTGLLISCPFCQQPIKRNALTTHIKTGHVNVKPCCKVCFKTFSTKSHLKRHMLVHEDRNLKEFECDLCFKSFHEKLTMQMHRLTHTHPYYCGQCDQTFLNRTLLNEHKSEGCFKSETRRDDLMSMKHMNIRGRPKKFPNAKPQRRNPRPKENPQCFECGEVLSNKRELQIHIQTTHENYNGDKMKRFECSICRKRFTSGAKLTMHERVHTNERPYPCDQCPNRFKTKTHLRTHQLTHSKEQKFKCPLCPRRFNLKFNLHSHLRSHQGAKSNIMSTLNTKQS